jgi:translocation and assembly module TamB
MRRSLIFLGLLLLAALALPPAAVYYAAYTQGGLRLIARLIPHHVGHLRLTIEGVSGTAVHGMHADRIDIDDRRVHLRFLDVEGRIALAPLLVRTLRVPHLSIGDLFIQVRPRGTYGKRSHWHFLPPGLEIRADDVEVASGTLIVPSGRRLSGTRLEAAGLVRRDSTRLDRASLTLGRVHLVGAGMLRAGAPFGMNIESRITIRVPGQPQWAIDAHGKGTVDRLALQVRFARPLQALFTGTAADLTHAFHWQGRAKIEDFELGPWHGTDAALGRVTGELRLEGDRREFTARGPLTPSGFRSGVFDAMMQGRYADRVITVERLVIRHPASGASVTGRGRIGIASHGPRLELSGAWSAFRWPLIGKAAAVRSPSGRYVLHGIWPYDLTARGRLAIEGLQPIGFALDGRIGKRHLAVTSASLSAFGGTARLTAGSAAWSPGPSWSAAGSAVGVSPSSVRPDLPGRLSFEFQAAGTHFKPGTDFTLAIRHLEGELRGLRASGSGIVSRRRSVWRLAGVKGRLGRTAFSLDGTIDDSLDLRFRVAASDLALLDPRLAGRLLASGKLSGPRRSPAIDAVASGGGIRYRGLSLASFAARVDFDPRRSGPSLVRLRAHDLAYRRRHIDVAFKLEGPAAREGATLSVSGTKYRLDASAVGTLAAGAWSGRVASLRFIGGGERLALEGASALSVSTRGIRLDRLCVAEKTARVCGAADWSPAEWSVSAFASGVPLALLTAGVSRNVRLRGVVDAALSLTAGAKRPARGHLSANVAGAEMLRERSDGRIETTRLGSAALTADATPQRIDVGLKVDAGSAGSIDGSIVARRSSAAWLSSRLTGTVSARTALGAWTPLYGGSVDRVSGELSADLKLGGSLATPLLSGRVDVANGAVDLYQYNLDVRDTRIAARFTDDGLDFSGAADVGAGTAAARGHLDWRKGAPFGRLTLTGSNLRVVDLPEAVVDASPNLDFAVDGQRVTVTGIVRIPHAHIAPTDLTNAVQVSPDQIIVGEPRASAAPQLKVASAITIELGDDVSIATQGLTGRLTGAVKVSTGADSITRATGELRITGGTYAAYGRSLDIARGRLIYTGSPIDDPGIDIRAQRTFQDPDVGAAVAGMDVRGTLREPRITFFSEPPLPQQQIISLVFAGGTLLGGPQLGVTASANTSRSVNAQLIGQGAAVLGSQIGLPLAIEPTYNNDTALVLGKYLSPRLYVSYGITLVQSLNIVKLRYTLGDHWSLSTEFGQLGGADLVYSFEK